MRVFDNLSAMNIERREWHLWLLALGMIVVLAAGMAVLMYPAVFSSPLILSGDLLRKSFFGFCTLSILLVGYLLDRQLEVRRLRKELEESQARNLRLRHQASADLLGTLPSFDHFQDRLAMEYRRATTTRQPLSMLIISLSASKSLTDPTEVEASYGDAAKAIVRRLRREDSLYVFKAGIFGIVLPGTAGTDAFRISDRLAEGLRDASGASDRFTFDLRVVNYPEHITSAHEMERVARSYLPEKSAELRAA